MIEQNELNFKKEMNFQTTNLTQEKNEAFKKLLGQVEWIKRQLEYSIYSLNHSVKYNLKKGEIYEFDWGINVNAEFSNRHYGVVLADSGIHNPLVIVCPLKTNRFGPHPRSDINIGEVKGLKDGQQTLAVINQIRTIDKLRLYTKQVINGPQHENDRLYLSKEKVDLILRNYYFLIINGAL